MPTRKASVLERILVVMIIYGLILFALHIYDYLVRAFEGHWVSIPAFLIKTHRVLAEPS